MKSIAVAFAIAGMILIGHARTVAEAQAEYSDGITVLSTREEGKGKDFKYVDVLQYPNGEIRIKIIHSPETIKNKIDSRVIPWLSGKGTLVSATTNKNGTVSETWKDEKGQTRTRKIMTSRSASKSKLLKASTNEVKVINFLDYNKNRVVHYVVTTNENQNTEIPTNLLSRARRSLLKSKKTQLLGADGDSNENVTVDENEVSNKVEQIRSRFRYRRYAHTGGYYLMDDGTYITYRDALNYGFAGNPTNEWMQAVFDEVTQDPNSLWTKRQYFDYYPLEVKESRHIMKPNKSKSKHAN